MTLADVIRDRMDVQAALGNGALARQAVDAVLSLHIPTDERSGWIAPGEYESMPSACQQCGSQDLGERWPCPTVRAVAAAIGVDLSQVGVDT